ncbi:hypothetical protein BJY01DRAFT_260827 [Aspergillus pseudoustus]|uniref:Gylcosyl hydrolase 115 C-terminal domain-containing protein n=1 Tax=Aspergillus pseudoustus TaxID=1810923 RepID=A0ABR4KGY5_9EURO
MYAPSFASHTASPGSVSLVNAPILVDDEDFEGVRIAVRSLSEDFARVAGLSPQVIVGDSRSFKAEAAILVGSVTHSRLIQSLIREGKLDVSAIVGKWETYTTSIIELPLPGVKKALVIAGNDKRGTIFGVYTLSEQIGVSPWHWWADTPVKQSTTIYALDVVTKDGPPSVKYRGIFINDEAPSLAGWLHEKIGPHFNDEFYKRVFELLLRLKANFLWPAMWFGFPHPGSSFFMDDPLNQETADRYGIVMSTSHHEPMQRAMNEWFDRPYFEPEGSWSWLTNKEKITKYFREGAERAKGHESYITMGMRGNGDRPMNVDDPSSVVKEVLSTQREIIKEAYGKEDGVPQLMALYKEVQEYYDGGLDIPDDVTLLFADDNFGTVRRLPNSAEARRRGRAGIYYHLEYVGAPRSYKWLNSNSCAKVWQQLEHTYNQGADQVWIFNVGDIKPLEIPLTFVLTLAWNIKALEMDQLPSFFHTFFKRNLSLGDGISQRCAGLLLKHERLVALRKHEHIEADTFSLLNYNEADNILHQWREALEEAEELQKWVPSTSAPAYFQLVLHPIKASYTYVALRINQAKNQHYGVQRRNTANPVAYEILRLFEEDFNLSEEYHSLLNGKWNHIMRQPHYGYTDTWHAPSRDSISGLSFVQTRQDSNAICGWIGVAVEGHQGVRPGLINEESDRTHPSRRDLIRGVTLPPIEPFGSQTRSFEIYCRGSRSAAWTITSPHEWLAASPPRGTTEPKGTDKLIKVSVDWAKVPEGFNGEVLLDLHSSLGDFEQIHVPVGNTVPAKNTRGFVEADGHVSINATSFNNTLPASYRLLPFIGRTPTGAVALAVNAPSTHSGYLEYPFITFTPGPAATLILEFTLTLDANPNPPITYDIQLDDGSITTHRLVPSPSTPGKLPRGWKDSVMDNIWKRRHQLDISSPGSHALKVRLGAQNCVLEKIVLDLGGVRESYLGPPESAFYDGCRDPRSEQT